MYARAALSNYVGGRVGTLSNNLVGLEKDDNALSNNLAYDYIKTRDLNYQFMTTYVQKYEIENILDLIEEATSGPYVLPYDISLSNLTVEKVKGIRFPEYVYVHGGLPDENLHQIGNPVQRRLEGHSCRCTQTISRSETEAG